MKTQTKWWKVGVKHVRISLPLDMFELNTKKDAHLHLSQRLDEFTPTSRGIQFNTTTVHSINMITI